jgi:hypothetical protein
MKKIALFSLLLLIMAGCKMTTWEEKTSDAYWDTSNLNVWDGEKWESVSAFNEEVALIYVGNWNENYRPDKIRITFNGADSLTLLLLDSASNEIYLGPISSGAEAVLNFSNDTDIETLSIYIPAPHDTFAVTKIEFGFTGPSGAVREKFSSRAAAIEFETGKSTSAKLSGRKAAAMFSSKIDRASYFAGRRSEIDFSSR